MVVFMSITRVLLVVISVYTLMNGEAARAEPFTEAKRFVFAEATSQTLLKSGQIDFSAAIALDQDIGAVHGSLEDALAEPRSDEPRYAIVMDVFLAQASRRVLDLKAIPSTLFLGFQGAPLSVPADDPARNAQGFDQIQAGQGSTHGSTQGAVGQPILLNYSYEHAIVQARRHLSARVYLIDRINKTYIRTTVDVAEEERFDIPYRVSYRDPRKESIRSEYSTEAELDDFEKLDLLIDLSDLLVDFQNKAGEAKSFSGAISLRRVIRTAQTQDQIKLEANRFDARPLNDPRFDSVVVVYTGKRSLGSGFYITPDVVMTNWHAVDGHSFVEMKAYDGLQTYGTVLGHDARLDIALLKVERRGRPVAFHTGRTLNPGSSVEAIGHPYGHEFSITRGVVSAVRRHFSINLPKKSGGEDVLFVQTDAPVNRGNSGGPLFLGQHVVGMNTWGRGDADGLNFSVHYSELLNFINEHLPGFHVNPAGGRYK